MRLRHISPGSEHQFASSTCSRMRATGCRLTPAALVLIVTACPAPSRPARAGLAIEAPNLTGDVFIPPVHSDILLMNTNSTGGASFNVASDNLAVSLLGPVDVTITSVSLTTSAIYIFAQSIDTNFGLPFATINNPPTSFASNDAGDVAAGYPGFQLVSPGQTYGSGLTSPTRSARPRLAASTRSRSTASTWVLRFRTPRASAFVYGSERINHHGRLTEPASITSRRNRGVLDRHRGGLEAAAVILLQHLRLGAFYVQAKISIGLILNLFRKSHQHLFEP